MERATVPLHVVRFGLFELSPDTAELRKGGIRLKLQDQPFHVLCTLLEHPGELVTREQLRQQLWPEGTFVDFEHGLNTAIKKLRDVMGDNADAPRYIETVPRKGYRFIAPIDGHTMVVPGATERPHSRLWIPALLAVVTVFLCVGVSLYYLRQPRYLRITETKQLTFGGAATPGFLLHNEIQTDGRRIYFTGQYQVGSRIYTVPVTSGDVASFETSITGPNTLDVSPDGTRLLVKAGLQSGNLETPLWEFSVNGGPGRRIGDVSVRFATWAPDRRSIAFATGRSLYITSDGGNTSHKLLEAPLPISAFRWSPDGKRLQLSLYDQTTMGESLWEGDSTNNLRRADVGVPNANLCCPVWSRDGHYLFFHRQHDQRSEYWAVDESWFPWRRRVAMPVAAGGLEIASLAASPFEDTLYIVGFQMSGLGYTYDLQTRKLTRILPDISVHYPRYSPDGQWLVFLQWRNSERVLWRARADGSELRQLTDAKLFVIMESLSPDGRRVALMAKSADGPYKIYWVSVDGGALHKLDVPVENQADPNWTPDGASIIFGQPPAFLADPGGPRALYNADLKEGTLTKLPATDGWFSPRLSHDGNLIAALSSDQHRLGVYEVPTHHWRVLVEEPSRELGFPFWGKDTDWIYYSVAFQGTWVLHRTNVRTGSQEEVLGLNKLTEERVCWCTGLGPDQKLLISCARTEANLYALRYE